MSEPTTAPTTAAAPAAAPMLTVVKGSPTPEELAALVLVVAAASSGGDDAAAPAPELSRWASRAGNLANAITWALAGVGTFRDVHYLYYDADPDAYARLAGEALAKQNAVLVHELSKAK